VEFSESARKHGISEASVLHAIGNAMVYVEQEYPDESRMLILGPDISGRMLEIVMVPSRDPERVIHADVMRPKFNELLRRGGTHR
jgi:hypothetical protein